MRVVGLAVSLVVALPGVARAQAGPPPPPVIVPPPPVIAPLPPPVIVVPQPAPAWMPPRSIPPESEAALLARRGRRHQIAGAVLMGVGSAVSVAGLATMLDGLSRANGPQLCQPGRCDANDQTVGGAAQLAIGSVAAIVGIPVFVVGVGESRRARAMRVYVGATPGGAALRF